MQASCCFSKRAFIQVQLFFAAMLFPLSIYAQPQAQAFPDSTVQVFSWLQPKEGAERGKLAGAVSPAIKNTALVATALGFWTTTFVFLDEPVQSFFQRYRGTVTEHVAGVVEPLGRQKYLMPAAGVVLASGLILKDEKLQKAGMVSIGSILVNAAATSTLKKSFGRHRPDVATENDRFDGPFKNSGHTSFPSSHTSTAFTVATSIASVYREHKLVPPIAYGLATLVGISRVHDNVHWATDVIKGAAVGYFSAKGVNYLYDLADQKLKNRRQKLLLAPNFGPENAGFSATLVF
ncbi:PAP2 family protein [Pontibacter diazotrophicus]|uniref:PAP2 family protein n=1 Tax=Pontibacter diazotrophicus TaxID=1400979 RepID=A0A3D8LDI5_9BACT|nr:phosphatase PAP2 family protein [Pontibacter diazotrophicus]RDV15519.1 PAP2 family protein [Pontibacter diazotrophicus]